MQLSRSARLYQERRIPNDQLTLRRPGPRHCPAMNAVHSIPLSPPFPLPSVLRHGQQTTPDIGHTPPWPWLSGEETIQV